MCQRLPRTDEETAECRAVEETMRRTGSGTFWKVFRVVWEKDSSCGPWSGKLLSQYRGGVMKQWGWLFSTRREQRPGEFEYKVSPSSKERALTPRERSSGVVNHGVHTYASSEEAAKSVPDCFAVVPVKGFSSDLVACGYEGHYPGAVFTKVYITREAYNSAISRATKPVDAPQEGEVSAQKSLELLKIAVQRAREALGSTEGDQR